MIRSIPHPSSASPPRTRAGLVASAGIALLALTGCGEESAGPVSPIVTPGLPASIAQASTPENLLNRLEAAWEFRLPDEYGALLAANYRFEFSAQSDPELVSIYGTTWDKEDELASARHLVAGFTNDEGLYLPAATRIAFAASGVSIVADPDHADSTSHYRLAIVPSLDIEVETAGQELVYEISSPHELHLVRGDAAVLDSTTDARADRWFVHRWEDHTPALAGARSGPRLGPARVLPATPVSWGRLKATYR